MFKLLHNSPFLYFDVISDAGGADSGSMSKDDIIEFLGQDDDEEVIPLKDDKKEDKKSDKKEKSEDDIKIEDDEEDTKESDDDEEDDELSDLEEELEETDEEKLELVTPVRRKEILKKYPTLFKDFPYLEKAYYREQKYTELLPTLDDAREAKDKAETLDKFEKDLMGGNTELVLRAIKQESPASFSKVVDNYLSVLNNVDEKAYNLVIGNTIKHTILHMVSEGRRSNNDALQSAAQILNQFVFGTSDFTPPEKLAKSEPERDEKEDRLNQRERQFLQQKFNSVTSDLTSRVNNSYRSTIEANIDPRESMTEYVRKNASREALETLDSLISKDTRFKVLVDKLWERAIKDDYNKESLDRIRSAFMSKAKTLLPSVIKKARTEALRGMGKRVRDDNEESTPKKGPVKESGKPRSQERQSGKITRAVDIPKGMSSLEFLMSED